MIDIFRFVFEINHLILFLSPLKNPVFNNP